MLYPPAIPLVAARLIPHGRRSPAIRSALWFFVLTFAWPGAPPARAVTYYIAPSGSDFNAGTADSPWRTLDKAASALGPGDTVLLADGDYPAGLYFNGHPGTADQPITFQAVHPGRAVIRGDWSSRDDALTIFSSDYVIIDGIVVRQAPRAGIRLVFSRGCIVRNCRLLNNQRWGVVTSSTDDLLIEDNETAGQMIEHGIYVANGGDRPIIRRNIDHHNPGAGIQINADPKLLDPSYGTSRDGITEQAVMEGNMVYEDGILGGAALNLASVRHSRIQNNLVYDNYAGGISLWDDNNTPDWGCKDNLILNNTVLFRKGEGRRCLVARNGSTNNQVTNNVFVGGTGAAILYTENSSVISDYNLLTSQAGPSVIEREDLGLLYPLASWQKLSGNDLHSLNADPEFIHPQSTPFDFRLRPDSPALDRGKTTDLTDDLAGNARPQGAGTDLGAYEGPGSIPPADATSTRPGAPIGLETAPGDQRVRLTWTSRPPEEGVIGYYVYRSTTQNGKYDGITLMPVFDLAWTDYWTPLTNGTPYWYRISAINDNQQEGPLSAPVTATPQLSASGMQIRISPGAVTGGGVVSGTLSFSSPPANGATIVFTSSQPKVAGPPAKVGVAKGQVEAAFTVTTALVQQPTTVTITASDAGTTITAPLIVQPTIKPPVSRLGMNGSDAPMVGGPRFTATVTLAGPAPVDGAIVTLSSSDTTVASVPASLLIKNGQTQGQFAVTTAAVSVPKAVTLTAAVTASGAPPQQLTLSFVPWLNALTLSVAALQGGGTASGQVTLSAPAPTGGVLVVFYSTSRSLAVSSPRLTVPAGQTAASFTVTTKPVTVDTPVTLTATVGKATATASLTLTVGPPPSASAPAGLRATPEGGAVQLEWTPNPETAVVGYNVYLATASSGPYSRINTTPVTQTTYVAQNLSGGKTYFFTVKAVTSEGESLPSAAVSATPEGIPPPAQPMGLRAASGGRGVILEWSANTEPDLAGYNVFRSTSAAGPYSRLNAAPLTVIRYGVAVLGHGTTYYFRVSAVNDGGKESAPSDPVGWRSADEGAGGVVGAAR